MRRVGPDKWASAGLAAAVLKLKWHFLSEAFRQTALFCPFTRNLRDTQTPITKYKCGHLKHRAVIGETDCGFSAGQRFMVRTHQLIEISLKMRNRFPRRFCGSCTRETAPSPKKSCAPSLYFSCSEKYASFIAYCVKEWYHRIKLPGSDKTRRWQRRTGLCILIQMIP